MTSVGDWTIGIVPQQPAAEPPVDESRCHRAKSISSFPCRVSVISRVPLSIARTVAAATAWAGMVRWCATE